MKIIGHRFLVQTPQKINRRHLQQGWVSGGHYPINSYTIVVRHIQVMYMLEIISEE